LVKANVQLVFNNASDQKKNVDFFSAVCTADNQQEQHSTIKKTPHQNGTASFYLFAQKGMN
jgi:hypothetical protein